jgi:hypothetical protein
VNPVEALVDQRRTAAQALGQTANVGALPIPQFDQLVVAGTHPAQTLGKRIEPVIPLVDLRRVGQRLQKAFVDVF